MFHVKSTIMYYFEYDCGKNGVLPIRCGSIEELYRRISYLNNCKRELEEEALMDQLNLEEYIEYTKASKKECEEVEAFMEKIKLYNSIGGGY